MSRVRTPSLAAVAAVIVSAMAAVMPSSVSAQGPATSVPPAPLRFVTDEAGFLAPETQAALEKRLAAFERSSGRQVIVWIGRTLGANVLEEWAARTFAAWGVGRKGLDNGVAIFVLADDRKIRIEVGYGLEDRLTDLRAARIIREEMAPRLQAGDRNGAVTAAVERVLAAVGGEAGQPDEPQAAADKREGGWGSLVLLIVVGGVFLFLFLTNPTLAVYLLTSMGSSAMGRRSGWGGGDGWGGGGGFSGGGGGFSGGGGRSGGGGASGSW